MKIFEILTNKKNLLTFANNACTFNLKNHQVLKLKCQFITYWLLICSSLWQEDPSPGFIGLYLTSAYQILLFPFLLKYFFNHCYNFIFILYSNKQSFEKKVFGGIRILTGTQEVSRLMHWQA